MQGKLSVNPNNILINERVEARCCTLMGLSMFNLFAQEGRDRVELAQLWLD